MRGTEILSLSLMGLNLAYLFYKIISLLQHQLWVFFLCGILAILISDFVSGLVHWFADTYGSLHWPVIGNSLIRSFREHHVDPSAITRHDFIELNGATALLSLPFLFVCVFLDLTSIYAISGVCVFIQFCCMSILTGQFHKWSHSVRVPKLIQVLQSKNIILSKQHHAGHHQGSFDRQYCMTTGWLNPLLNQIGFFRKMENAIFRISRVLPRVEDQKLFQISAQRSNF